MSVMYTSQMFFVLIFICLLSSVDSFDMVHNPSHGFRRASVALGAATQLLDDLDTGSLLTGTMLKGKNLQLIYRATRDGWSAADFHKKADVGLPSLLCVQVSAGSGLLGGILSNKAGAADIVGGYNPFGWSSVDDYRNTRNAFVFRKDGATGELFKCAAISAEGAVYDFGEFGPSFGVEALIIPLNPSKMPLKTASSILGNDYQRLSGGASVRGSSGISARRSGVTVAGNSLFGSKITATLSEIEIYIDAAALQ